MRLRFLSSNPSKVAEVQAILGQRGVDIVPVMRKLDEVQSTDVESIVHDKCVRAFRMIGRPVFVEHTGLFIDALNGFPGGLTQIFWDTLDGERIIELFGRQQRSTVKASTRIAYCDGRCIHQFEGTVAGRFASEFRGSGSRHWDAIFVPEGSEETFSEMGERKHEISMRRRALDEFADFLDRAQPVR